MKISIKTLRKIIKEELEMITEGTYREGVRLPVYHLRNNYDEVGTWCSGVGCDNEGFVVNQLGGSMGLSPSITGEEIHGTPEFSRLIASLRRDAQDARNSASEEIHQLVALGMVEPPSEWEPDYPDVVLTLDFVGLERS